MTCSPITWLESMENQIMENQIPIMEIIHVRLYDPGEADKVLMAFLRLRESFGTCSRLYRDSVLVSDWIIRIDRSEVSIQLGKSPPASCAVELLRPVGLVHHAVWNQMPIESFRTVNGFTD